MTIELARIAAKMVRIITETAEESTLMNWSDYQTVDIIRGRIVEIADEAMEYLN